MSRISILLGCYLICLCGTLTAQRIYVKAGSNGDGSSWTQAAGDLRAVLQTAVSGEEIWVAEGSYYPTSCTTCSSSDRNIYFQVWNNVKLYGGFNGTETILSQRDWIAHPTILSGDIDLDASQANNSYTILFTHNVSENTIIDGFFVQQANAQDTSANFGAPGNTGGGWYNDGSQLGSVSNPTVRNCTFRWNEAAVFGGGAYNDGCFEGMGSPTLINCKFEQNSSSQGGGGMYNNGSFDGNCNPAYIHCEFNSNTTGNSGAGIFNNGLSGNSSPLFSNCSFYDNRSDLYGGALYNLGKEGISSPQITNCLFNANRGSAAGGIYNLGSENGNSSPKVTNCTFYGNVAPVGASIYNQAGDSTGNCSPVVSNSIFYGNNATSGFGSVFQNVYGTPSISYCLVDVDNCSELNTGLNGTTSCGAGLIFNEDPLMLDPSGHNFRISDGSPVIDAGNNNAITNTGILVDLDSLTRISNGVVDYGAYEFQVVPYTAPSILSQPQGQAACEGSSVQLEVIAEGTRPLLYQWQKEGLDISGATDSILEIGSVVTNNSGTYRCRIVSIIQDSIWSDTANLRVDPVLPVSLNITASDSVSCSGDRIVMTAQPVNGGTQPNFQWTINDVLVGTNSPLFTSTELNQGDEVRCLLHSSESCVLEDTAFSNTLSMNVSPLLVAAVSIEMEADTMQCLGDTIAFVATAVNGGAQAIFRWLINGNEVFVGGASFKTDLLNDKDQLSCILESSEICLLNEQVFSNLLDVELKDCTSSIRKISSDSGLRIFPNPASDQLALQFEKLYIQTEVLLLDQHGRVVRKFRLSVTSAGTTRFLDLSGIPNGLYIVEILSGENSLIEKILITDK